MHPILMVKRLIPEMQISLVSMARFSMPMGL
jgi:hypothetical protein